MKLLDDYVYGKQSPIEVSEAVRRTLDGSSYDSGELEALRGTIDNTVRFIADLVQMLVDKALNEDDIEKLMPRFKVVKDAD